LSPTAVASLAPASAARLIAVGTPCQALVESEWIPATLLSWRQDPDGWKAGVRYTRRVAPITLTGPVASTSTTPVPFTWERTMRADQVRAAQEDPHA
jgi:hypothetical protein